MYLMSSMTSSQNAAFYKYHRYLGLATYIAGLVAGAVAAGPLLMLYCPCCSTATGAFTRVKACGELPRMCPRLLRLG